MRRNTKPSFDFFFTLWMLALIFSFSGCSDSHPAGEKSRGPEENKVVQYHAQSGLFVPARTAEYIGLEIKDVDEQNVEHFVQFKAQVYQSSIEGNSPQSASTLISAMINLSDAKWIKPGQAASIEWGKGKSLPGQISEIHREIETISGQTEVVIIVQDPEGALPRGAFLQVTIKGENSSSGVSIPRSALLKTAEGNFVYTVNGKHFVRAKVEIGNINDERVEITDGLYSGDEVVTKPVMTLWVSELQFIRGGKSCADGH